MLSGIAPCGMRYVVLRSGSAVAYVSLGVRVGTRDEGSYHSGIAHFLEHAMFRGTRNRSARVINSYLDRLGGELNAYTTKEEIVLHATVLKEDLRKAGSLLLELASSPVFPSDGIQTERGVVMDEILSYKDTPADDVYDKFEEHLFGSHPLGRPILGSVASVKKIDSAELARFHGEMFAPGSMALSVVAPLEEAKMADQVLGMISKFYPGAAAEAVSGPGGGVLTHGRELSSVTSKPFDLTVDKRNHEVNAVLGALAPCLYEERRRYSAVLLSNILGGPCSNSILNEVLRERNGWVYAVETSYTQYSDAGVMVVSLGCDKSNLARCEEAVRREIARLQDKCISERRLRSAKKQLLGQLAISWESGESQCLSMGKNLLCWGRISPEGEVAQKVMDISAEELRDMACEIFRPDRVSRLVFL